MLNNSSLLLVMTLDSAGPEPLTGSICKLFVLTCMKPKQVHIAALTHLHVLKTESHRLGERCVLFGSDSSTYYLRVQVNFLIHFFKRSFIYDLSKGRVWNKGNCTRTWGNRIMEIGIDIYILVVQVQSLICVWLCDPMDCSPPGSSVHGISQAGILEWVAISFSRGSSWPRDWTCVSCIIGGFFTTEPPGKPLIILIHIYLVCWIQLMWCWASHYMLCWRGKKLKFYITSSSFCFCNSAFPLQSLGHAGHVVSESGDWQY